MDFVVMRIRVCRLFIAVFCATLSIANCFSLFQHNYELIYDYNSKISSGVIGRSDNVSDLQFYAQITIRTYPNLTYVTLNKVNYDYGLGEDSLAFTADAAKLPEDILRLPFVIRYNESALITDILTDAKDELWSINIKRGIASLFQMDLEHVTKDESRMNGFFSEENTVAGRCRVAYSFILAEKASNIVMIKQIDMSSCQQQTWTETSKTGDQPVSVLSSRAYKMSDFINSIVNENTVTISPTTGGTYIQMINTTQSIVLAKKDKFNEASLPSIDNMISTTLDTNFTDKYDVTGGRMTFDLAAIVKELKTLFQLLSDDVQVFNINIGSSVSTKEELFRTIVKKMELLNESQLVMVLDSLKGNKNDVKTFFKTIRFVGTRSSMMFIKNYILDIDNFLLKTPIENFLEEDLFGSIATNWKHPDLDVLKEFSILIRPETHLNEKLKRDAILAVSTMIAKFMPSNELEVIDLVELYIDGLKSSKTEADQMVYILGMKNICSARTTLFLETLVRQQVGEYTPFIRSVAVWALEGALKMLPLGYNRLFLSLISNSSEECNVRCSALHVYLAEPTVTKVMQLYTFMEAEQHGAVYSAFYTKVASLASLKAPRFKQVADYSRTILKGLAPVPYAMNIQKIVDHYDAERDIVSTMTFSMAGNLYKDGYFAAYFDLPDILDENSAIFIRFRLDDLKSGESKSSLVGKEYFKNLVSDIMNSREVKFDFVMLIDGVVQAPIYENLSWAAIRNTNFLAQIVSCYLLKDREVVIPTDVGLPVVYFTNTLSSEMINLMLENTNPQMAYVTDFVSKAIMQYGLKFYNPVANIWQGVKRTNIMYTDSPFNMTFNLEQISDSTPKLTFFFNHTRDGIVKAAGLETLVYTDVYVEDYAGVWTKTCPTCHTNLVLSDGNRKDFTIWKNSCDMFGVDYELTLYDCETSVGQDQISKIRSSLFNGFNQNWMTTSFDSKFLSLLGPYRNAFLLSNSNHCGVRLMAKPDHTHSTLTLVKFPSHREKTLSLGYTMNDEGTRGWSFSLNSTLLELVPTMTPSMVLTYNQLGKETTTIESHYSLSDFNMTNDIKVSTSNSDDPTDMTLSFAAGLEHIIDEDAEKIYDECIGKGNGWQCTAQATYLNSYVYEFNFAKISKEHQKLWRRMFYLFQALYGDYFVYSEDVQKWHKNSVKILVNITSYNEADVTVLTEVDSFHYKGIPMNSFLFSMLFQPVSTHLPTGWTGLTQSVTDQYSNCDATKDYVKMTTGVMSEVRVGEEWTNLLSLRNEEDKECSYCAYYRLQNQTNLGLRLVTPDGILEAYKYNKENIHVVWKDKTITLDSNGYFVDDIIKIKMLYTPRMLLLFRQEYFNIDFTDSQIRIQFQKSKGLLKSWSGKCLPEKEA